MGNSGAFELVTGHGAEPHVDADDHALLYASFIGSGVYRLIGVKTAEIEVTSENEVTISPGMFLIHGRFARVKDPISLSIETGSQGQNRNDLEVCEYSYSGNETEIDDMELVVVTGTPANPGSETDPSIEDDLTLFDIEYGGSITDETIIQVPLWRVPKEGLTTQDPVALFKDYVDATTARSSIVQNCIRKITTTSKAINEGSNYNWSVDTDIVDEFYPVGIVGIEPKYSTSLRILSFNLDGTTAWLQSECKTKRTDMTVTFHILYAPM